MYPARAHRMSRFAVATLVSTLLFVACGSSSNSDDAGAGGSSGGATSGSSGEAGAAGESLGGTGGVAAGSGGVDAGSGGEAIGGAPKGSGGEAVGGAPKGSGGEAVGGEAAGGDDGSAGQGPCQCEYRPDIPDVHCTAPPELICCEFYPITCAATLDDVLAAFPDFCTADSEAFLWDCDDGGITIRWWVSDEDIGGEIVLDQDGDLVGQWYDGQCYEPYEESCGGTEIEGVYYWSYETGAFPERNCTESCSLCYAAPPLPECGAGEQGP